MTVTTIPLLTRLEVVLHAQLPNSGLECRGQRKRKLQFRGLRHIAPTS